MWKPGSGGIETQGYLIEVRIRRSEVVGKLAAADRRSIGTASCAQDDTWLGGKNKATRRATVTAGAAILKQLPSEVARHRGEMKR